MVDQLDPEDMNLELIRQGAETYTHQGNFMIADDMVIKSGPQVRKEVSLRIFPDLETGEVRGRSIKLRGWRALPRRAGGGYDFSKPTYEWSCEDLEIDALREFLNNNIPERGHYRIIPAGGELRDLLSQVEVGEIASADIIRLLQIASSSPDLISELANSQSGALLAEAVELRRRRDQLNELRAIVEDSDSGERADIHPKLKQMGWVFGGQYVGESARKQLTIGDVLDIPLLRADGSLHVVELKSANIPKIIQRHRGPVHPMEVSGIQEELPLIVGSDVHEAVGQAMNYLCHLDEERHRILANLAIDTRRASATVLIGHPKFSASFTKKQVDLTFRLYNSHYSRIEVRHYQDLIECAERSLALAERTAEDDHQHANPSIDDPWADSSEDSWRDPDPDGFSEEPPF